MKTKKIHGETQSGNVPKDIRDFSPCDCKFNKDDVVDFINDYGVVFYNHIIQGFTPEITSWGGFIYLDLDCWWFPIKEENIRIHQQ